AAAAMLLFPGLALAQRAQYDALVASHAQANGVPEALVHRVIVRESRYRPGLIGRGGTIGMMQIKLATARGLGYTGTAEGLRDPGDPLNLIRVMPAKGQGCTRVRSYSGGICPSRHGGNPPFPLSVLALPVPGRPCCSRKPAVRSRCTSAAMRR